MQIDLDGKTVALVGETNPIAEAAFAAMLANGGSPGDPPDMLLVSLPLLPGAGVDARPLLTTARKAAERMAAGAGGRIVLLLSAIAGLPMRRHPDFSAAMAGAQASMRTLAMAYGPAVLVNAVGIGAIGAPALAGDEAMLSHAAIQRPGTIAEVVAAVLFFCDPLNTYTTGQVLNVDGGWMAGYGRHF